MASSALLSGVRVTLPTSGYIRLSDGTLLNVPTAGGGGGTTYSETITMGSNQAIIPLNTISFQDLLTITTSLGVDNISQINYFNSISLGNSLYISNNNTINTISTINLSAINTLSSISNLQASGAIDVSATIGNALGLTAQSDLIANNTCAIGINAIVVPIGNLNTVSTCTFGIASEILSAGGFSVIESITLQSTLGIVDNVQLEIAGTVSLTSALGQAIAQNALINGELALTTAIAENIVTTLLAQDAVGIGFEILSTFTGTNPAVLARIGTQEILFTVATSKLHFVNSGKDTLFTSS